MPQTSVENRTVVGLFDTMENANRAVSALEKIGITRSNVSVITSNESGNYGDLSGGTGEAAKTDTARAGTGAAIGGGLGLIAGLTALAIPGFGPLLAAGPIAAVLGGAGVGAAAGGLIGGLSNAGVSESDAAYYAEGIRRGGVLLSVRTNDADADRVADILDDNGARDIDEKGREWQQGGWSVPTGGSARAQQYAGTSGTMQGEQSIPVVEETLKVGKREAVGGGVRVYSHVTERPVEEQIDLREEHVRVERRPVNRAATEADFQAFREGTIELTETREEPVVAKEARVVEEVLVGKDVSQRTETVRDTVRRTEVTVENTGSIDYDNDFRSDYQTRYGAAGKGYDYYAPAYRTGSTWASNAKYSGRNWDAVESDVRTDWESGAHGKWEDFKDAIRHGWDRVRGRS